MREEISMPQDGKIKEQPLIPSGWTYLVHGSNAERWKPDELGQDFTVSRPLSCITKQDMETDKRHGFQGSAYTYSSTTQNPFQIRVLFFKNVIHSNAPDCQQVKKELSPETIQDITSYYSYQQWRHPAVPSKTKLIKIAQTDYDEVYDRSGQTIYWYVPEQYLGMYQEALKKGNGGFSQILRSHSESLKKDSEKKNIFVGNVPIPTR